VVGATPSSPQDLACLALRSPEPPQKNEILKSETKLQGLKISSWFAKFVLPFE
jgi:hypothetical protein